MTASLVEKIADAVLYEGYILYPYRPSAVKNQQRWNFGSVCPRSYSESQAGTEAWTMQTECLIHACSDAALDIKVRFLHLVTRTVGRTISDCQLPIADCGHDEVKCSTSTSHFSAVASLEINGQLYQSWQEAVEREVQLSGLKPSAKPYRRQTFSFAETETVEPLNADGAAETAGMIVRRQQAIEGAIEVWISDIEIDHLGSEPPNSQSEAPSTKCDRTLKVTVKIINQTAFENAGQHSRDEALMRSFVSTHTILKVRGGEFVSLLDPPEALRGAAAGCKNTGTYPVLVGEGGARDCMLSSPIILYDYPEIAPESAGDLFDGTEIDEILTLRIMALTDEEKREMCSGDERARQILERTETLPQEQLMKMHGAMKGVNRKS